MTARAPAHGRLLFDALGKQATIGPCNEPRPSMFDPVAKARYNAWKQLGKLSKIEAMVRAATLRPTEPPRRRLAGGRSESRHAVRQRD